MDGRVKGHEGRHRSLAAKIVNIDEMLVIVHLDDRCINLYEHPKYPNSPNMISPEVMDLSEIRPPEKLLEKILELQRTKIKHLPDFMKIDKDGYGILIMAYLSKERHDGCWL